MTASSTISILLDHPAINNNPNAIIVATPRTTGGFHYQGNFFLQYVSGNGKWYIVPTGTQTVITDFDVDVKSCTNSCTEDVDLGTVTQNALAIGHQFNVIVISK